MRTWVVLIATAVALMAVPAEAGAAPSDAPNGSLDRLVELVLRRLNTGDSVAAAKWAAANGAGIAPEPTIDDPVREAQVYDAMARLGAERKLPESWLRSVFFGQIEANKVVQRGLMARWRFEPAAAPAVPPDLATVRPVIDAVNTEIVAQLAARRAELSAPDCAQRLARSVFGAFATDEVDTLHQAALVRATVTLCPSA